MKIIAVFFCLLAYATAQNAETDQITLNFPSTAAGTCSELTSEFTSAGNCMLNGGNTFIMGFSVSNAVASASNPGTFFSYISDTGVVTIRFCNPSSTTAVDPPSGTFRVTAFRPEC
jgi:hypothetical protein